MFVLVATAALMFGPPDLPVAPETSEVSEPSEAVVPVEGPAPVEAPPPEEPAIVVDAALPAHDAAPPPAVVVVVAPTLTAPSAAATPSYLQPTVPRRPPWSGSGRLVGGSFMLVLGTGIFVAAAFEFSTGHDTTRAWFSQVPGGIVSVVAGGVMIGTASRDRYRLGEWEAANDRRAPPTGNGLIVGGVITASLGTMAAVATSIAADMDLDAPRSLPAGWATAGVGIGGGAALLIAGIVRRSKYGRAMATPTVAPMRAGASIGVSGQF